MRISLKICIILFGFMLLNSCSRTANRFAGFSREPYATVSIPYGYSIYGLSHVDDEYYYLLIDSDTCELAISRKNLSLKEVPITSKRNKHSDNSIYEDEKWTIKYVSRGEFGHAMWFIDKRSRQEYVYNGMRGSIRYINGAYFIVNPTRVYCIEDPHKGVECDSSTRYENTKDERLLNWYLRNNGTSMAPVNAPIICHDGEHEQLQGFRDSYYVSDDALYHSDTTIVGSFVSDNCLYLLEEAKGSLALTRIDTPTLSQTIVFEYGSLGKVLGGGVNDNRGNLVCLIQDQGGEKCFMLEMSPSGNVVLQIDCNSVCIPLTYD